MPEPQRALLSAAAPTRPSRRLGRRNGRYDVEITAPSNVNAGA